MFQVFLFLHVGAAILAFGPTFAFSIIGSMGGKEPMFGNFATRVSAAILDRLVIPVALTMPVSGIGLIWTKGIDVFASTSLWLLVGIAIYVVAIVFAVFVQRAAVHRVIELTSRPPDPAASGPPPELMATVKKIQRGGMLLSLAIASIVFLMIFKPGS